jgi:hypothetical protein
MRVSSESASVFVPSFQKLKLGTNTIQYLRKESLLRQRLKIRASGPRTLETKKKGKEKEEDRGERQSTCHHPSLKKGCKANSPH